MRIDRIACGQGLGHALQDAGLGQPRLAPRQREIKQSGQDVFPAREGIGYFGGQDAAQAVGYRVAARAGHHIGGRALQQGHMGRQFGHLRHQGHSSGATADDHHLLATVVQVLRPMLGVHPLAFEAVHARQGRCVAMFVVVVAAAHQQETTLHLQHRAVGQSLYRYTPTRNSAIPIGR